MPNPAPTLERPDPAEARATLKLVIVTAVLAATAAAILAQTGGLDGLAKAAGQSPKSGGAFASFQKYLEGLQDAVIPLAIPAATLGLIGGGIAYLIGSQLAQKMLGGVVIGVGLVLLSPELIK